MSAKFGEFLMGSTSKVEGRDPTAGQWRIIYVLRKRTTFGILVVLAITTLFLAALQLTPIDHLAVHIWNLRASKETNFTHVRCSPFCNGSTPSLKLESTTFVNSNMPSTSPTLMTSTSPTSTSLTSTSVSTSKKISRRPTPTLTKILTSVRVTARPSDVSRYVTFLDQFRDGRGLGNQIFNFAAVLYVAQLTDREPAFQKLDYVFGLDRVFQINVERFDSLCPCFHIHESRHLAFDEETDKKALNNMDTANKAIVVTGFRQSWRYTLAIERPLRRHLVFKDELKNFAERFLSQHIPPKWGKAGFIRVGIHIRRGDILNKNLAEYGYTVPNASYFKKAMKYFTDKYHRVQFITVSEDKKWVEENISAESGKSKSVNVTHAFGHNAGQDLALLSTCDHAIVSSGTFGWWGAWLAKGTTIYYGNWPRNGSELQKQFRREDFFPPSWIPLND